MPDFYLDTSALVKRYITEHGSEVVDALLEPPAPADLLVISFLAVLEVNAAIISLSHRPSCDVG